ncbi:uncharacterized protein LOC133797950 isoform X4 [Humulus lupulus]|uniref:uncharacterized protein LOC133797950 isoform X4 n=1 Tax=Humulus lupulus TaxID=3486 RepID=UPI002B40C568|nr:uncharacterized protein LOC133797950 isoform X4 [Humulus lupulus]
MLYVYQMMETRSFGKSLRNPMSFWPTEMSRTILFALVSIVSSHIRCNFTNFARNICCLKCKAEGPKKSGESDIEMKKGICCHSMVSCSRTLWVNFSQKC